MFLPGWEEGVFPSQRALDDQGRAGLEEERRLAYVGITRARKRRAKISFAPNRRMHGLWQTAMPSRFLDELPEAKSRSPSRRRRLRRLCGLRRLALRRRHLVRLNYNTPGWQRAQAKKSEATVFRSDDARYVADDDEDDLSALSRSGEGDRATRPPKPAGRRRTLDRVGAHGNPGATARIPLTIEGELIAKSTGTTSAFTLGDRVFHQKFGNGNVIAIDGNKLTIQFDRAGEKRVVDSFVERV